MNQREANQIDTKGQVSCGQGMTEQSTQGFAGDRTTASCEKRLTISRCSNYQGTEPFGRYTTVGE